MLRCYNAGCSVTNGVKLIENCSNGVDPGNWRVFHHGLPCISEMFDD